MNNNENNNNIFGTNNDNQNNIFKNDNVDMPNQNSNNQPIIEIPQEYYDKIAAEEAEKQNKILEEQKQIELDQAIAQKSSGIWIFIIINAAIISSSIYFFLDKSIYTLVALLSYVIVGSLFFGLKYKKDSYFSASYMVGGIIGAVVFFLLSMVRKDETESWIHYALITGIVSFMGWIISALITYISYNHKNIKALQTIGIFLVLIIVIGTPVFIYKKYPDTFNKFIYNQQTKIVATSEQEFVEKTLKNRYGIDFTCQKGKRIKNVHNYVTTQRTCEDNNSNKITVIDIAYNESEYQYIVQDNYMSVLYLNKFKKNTTEVIDNIVNGKSSIALYPKQNWCSFVGDCHDCDEYYNVYTDELDIKKQFEYSKNLKLTKYINMDAKDFVNTYEFKYIIEVSLTSDATISKTNEEIVSDILEKLNNEKINNNYGFEIVLKNTVDSIVIPIYKAKGEATSNKEFSKFEEVDVQ